MHEMYQFVVNLDISHNSIVEIPNEVSRMVLVRKMIISHNYLEKYPKVLNEGDFPSTLTHLDISHNLLTILPPDVANLKKLQILLLAGHYWEEGGLPVELASLNFLTTIDLSGKTIRPDSSMTLKTFDLPVRISTVQHSGVQGCTFFQPNKMPMINQASYAHFLGGHMILFVISMPFLLLPQDSRIFRNGCGVMRRGPDTDYYPLAR